MERVNSYTVGEQLLPSELNQQQDTTLGIAQLQGAKVGPMHVESTGGSDVFIGPIAGLMTTANPNHNLSTSSVTTYTASSPALAADTWYYLYAYNNSGAIAFEHSTTAPDAFLVFKTGDTTRRFITAFRTRVSAATILGFWQQGDHYMWRTGLHAANEFRALSGDTNTSYTTLALATWVAPIARVAFMKAALQGTGSPPPNPPYNGYIRTIGDNGNDGNHFIELNGTSPGEKYKTSFRMPLSATRTVEHKADSGSSLSVWVDGFALKL